MQLFRHLGLMIAVFWCAAMVVAPMAAASGAGQDTNHGPQGMGPSQGGFAGNQMQQGTGQGSGSGNSPNWQDNQDSNPVPGQGGRPQGMARGNTTGMNMTRFTVTDGNRTGVHPPGDRDPDNTTAINMTGWHGHRPGNTTPFNMTDLPPPGERDPANMTAANQSWHGHGDGNLTPPDQLPQQGKGNSQGWQGGGNQQQADSRNGSGDSLIDELIGWLKARGIS